MSALAPAPLESPAPERGRIGRAGSGLSVFSRRLPSHSPATASLSTRSKPGVEPWTLA